MKKWIAAFMIAIILVPGMVSASYQVPEAFMGFSVPDGWFIFSKNMEDQALLDAVDLTVDEVNESLVKSDCEYFITNPEKRSEIYVKVRSNALSDEFYNILETEDDILLDEMDRILADGFSVDQFDYLSGDVVITPYSQMKFVTIPGTAQIDGKRYGMIFGFTFVNGKGIAFMMQVDTDTPVESDIATMQDIANSVSFTVIKEKGEASEPAQEDLPEEDVEPNSFQYIVGGLAALAFAALLLYLYHCLKKNKTKPKAVNKKDHENHETD